MSQNNITRKEEQEARKAIKEAMQKGKLPSGGKNILEWTLAELNAYVSAQTNGMSIKDKFKFVNKLQEEIKAEKKKQGITK